MALGTIRRVVIVLAVVGCNAVFAESFVCTNEALERLIDLRYDSPGQAVPCEIRYTKPTEGVGEQVLWRAEREEGYCEAELEGFIAKLSGWGWSCTETGDASAIEEPAESSAETEDLDEPESATTESEPATTEPEQPEASEASEP